MEIISHGNILTGQIIEIAEVSDNKFIAYPYKCNSKEQPIGIAARDIKPQSRIKYNPTGNTKDVITRIN